MANFGSKHTDPLWTRKKLLEYLTQNKEASLTRAAFALEKNGRDAEIIINKMQAEELITIEMLNQDWRRGLVRITPKGYEVYQTLSQMHMMMELPSSTSRKST